MFRYLFDRKALPLLNNKRIPHMGNMFKTNGYRTGIFGKTQPFPNQPTHATKEGNLQINKNKDAIPKHDLGWAHTGQKVKPNVFV